MKYVVCVLSLIFVVINTHGEENKLTCHKDMSKHECTLKMWALRNISNSFVNERVTAQLANKEAPPYIDHRTEEEKKVAAEAAEARFKRRAAEAAAIAAGNVVESEAETNNDEVTIDAESESSNEESDEPLKSEIE